MDHCHLSYITKLRKKKKKKTRYPPKTFALIKSILWNIFLSTYLSATHLINQLAKATQAVGVPIAST
jgi:uncharacterized membrane protein YccF (DUF307 family)